MTDGEAVKAPALSRGKSGRNIQLRQQQQKSIHP